MAANRVRLLPPNLFHCIAGSHAVLLINCLYRAYCSPFPVENPPMLRLDADRGVSVCDGLTRRDFLHAGALPLLGLTLPGFFARRSAAAKPDEDVNCIMLFLLGAPSHIDTWDPKPSAPAEVRGPYKPIATKADGIRITEIFPKMAQHADKYSLIR